MRASLPSLPGSRPRPEAQTSTEPPPNPIGLSPGSSEQRISAESFREAIASASDIAFVLIGRILGRLDRHGREWEPTLKERRRLAEPLSRIIRRHVQQGIQAADAIDVAAAVGAVGAFVLRASDTPETDPEDQEENQ